MANRLGAIKLLAVTVMQWDTMAYEEGKIIYAGPRSPTGNHWKRLGLVENDWRCWDPFNRPADAVELAEAMRKRGYGVNINCARGGDWICTLIEPQRDNHNYFQIGSFADAVASSVLEAVKSEVAAEVKS